MYVGRRLHAICVSRNDLLAEMYRHFGEAAACNFMFKDVNSPQVTVLGWTNKTKNGGASTKYVLALSLHTFLELT